jgi:hypothetical protein
MLDLSVELASPACVPVGHRTHVEHDFPTSIAIIVLNLGLVFTMLCLYTRQTELPLCNAS